MNILHGTLELSTSLLEVHPRKVDKGKVTRASCWGLDLTITGSGPSTDACGDEVGRRMNSRRNECTYGHHLLSSLVGRLEDTLAVLTDSRISSLKSLKQVYQALQVRSSRGLH